MSLLSRLAVTAARAYGILSSNPNNVSADFLVVAGGGPGGYGGNAYFKSGGGGAGGFRTSAGTSGGGASAESPLTLSTLNTYSIVVGAGGTVNSSTASNGSNSSISGTGITTITSTGGGVAGGGQASSSNVGVNGGSGGGAMASSYASDTTWSGGSGTANQGYAGGTGYFTSNTTISYNSGAGGGGAGSVGSNGVNNTTGNGGNGGAGVASSISGSSVTYAGGGGGGGYSTGGTGGSGGGGNGGGGAVGSAGTANTGGGGGGSAGSTTATTNSGGSGIVIISYTSATPKFVGGTITTSGGKQIHTFTSSGTLSPITPITASYLVVAGGASGGDTYGGGGGAGGLQTGSTTIYSGATYVVTVGAGGAATTSQYAAGNSGSNSVLSGTGLTTITSIGGGAGGGNLSGGGGAAATGGSGGGGGAKGDASYSGAAGTSGQGYAGGNGSTTSGGGGGGGSSAVGSNGSGSTGGAGGAGTASSITGTSVTYAGGGGGGASGTGGAGGSGGGGAGGGNTYGVSGTTNTGSGGGGSSNATSGKGGSGVVIISYAGSQVFNGGLVTTSGGNTIHTFTSTGALTPLTNNLNNSLRFRSSASAYLTRTPTSTGNQRTFTFSGWVKRGKLGTSNVIMDAFYGDSGRYALMWFNSSDCLRVSSGIYSTGASTTTSFDYITTQVFRDPSAWYHIVVAVDTTQATSGNRVKIYVNGNQVTSFSTSTAPTQNDQTYYNVSTTKMDIGYYAESPGYYYLDGYLADINWIDGQQLEPYYFGNNDANGVWKPIQYKGTYGTNGFYLPFTPNTTSSYQANYTTTSQYLKVASNVAFGYGTGNFTIEGWHYLTAAASSTKYLFDQRVSSATLVAPAIYIDAGKYVVYINGSVVLNAGTVLANQWIHWALVKASGVTNLYINGVSVGNFNDTNNYVTSAFNMGNEWSYSGSFVWSGYLSNIRVVKGTAVYTSNFVPSSTALTAVSGTSLLTLQNSSIVDNSTNAFSITNNGSVTTSTATPFTANIFCDSSGNANNWLATNINVTTTDTTYDAMLDVPTNTSATVANYGTFNPLNALNTTTTDANLGFSMSASSTQTICGTFGMNSGKWYFEFAFTSAGSSVLVGGIVGSEYFANATRPYQTSTGYMYIGSSGNKINNNTGAAYGSTYTTNDIIGVAVDLDNGKIWFSKNGTWQASGDPAAGTNAAYTGLSGTYVPSVTNGNDGVTYAGWINCGQRPFTYTPPTGFNRLNTYNLPTPTILQGNKYMDATLYTGTGTDLVIANQGQFKPDFVWTKCRSNAVDHCLVDAVRGGNKILYSDLTNAEDTSTFLSSFNSNGYTISSNAGGGGITSGRTYVGWQWQAGQGSTSSNTSGSVTSTVSVNSTAGFSVCTFTTPSASHSNFTFGHGLGVVPKMVIVKSRSAATDWVVYHASVGATKGLYLNQNLAAQTSTGFWQDTTPSSTLVYIGTGFAGSSETAVAYCWAEIAGFSAFGSYTGNGSSDGPFVYLGFRPKYVLIKGSSSGGLNYDWYILDSSRDTYNLTTNFLCADLSQAEATGVNEDLLSNGFKIRGTTTGTNTNAVTYIYAAFAENPFKNANAR